MVLNLNIVSLAVFLLIIAGIFLVRWGLVTAYKKSTKDLVKAVKALSEKEHQQQVIYNISTSIFLLRSVGEIIRSTISEIVIMYHWSNVAYFPYGEKQPNKDFYGQAPKYSVDEVFQVVGRKGETSLNNQRLGEFISIFLVGGQNKPLGALYVSKVGSLLSDDQTAFFKTVASFLTIALDNINFLNHE